MDKFMLENKFKHFKSSTLNIIIQVLLFKRSLTRNN